MFRVNGKYKHDIGESGALSTVTELVFRNLDPTYECMLLLRLYFMTHNILSKCGANTPTE